MGGMARTGAALAGRIECWSGMADAKLTVHPRHAFLHDSWNTQQGLARWRKYNAQQESWWLKNATVRRFR